MLHVLINCVADSPTAKVLTSYKAAIIIVVVFTCIVVLLITAYTRWHLELCLFWKDHFGKLEDGNKLNVKHSVLYIFILSLW
jgi:hypothetical protein